MGACATKPRALKEELAPHPLPAVEDKAEVVVGEKATEKVADADDIKRKSLGQMFIESEERKVASETGEVTVKETITPAAPVEAKEEQTNTQEPPVEKFVTPTPEEVSAPSEVTEATAEEKHVDSSANAEAHAAKVEAVDTSVEKKEEAATEKANAELQVPTEKVNAELPVPSSTEEVVAESNTKNVVAESNTKNVVAELPTTA